MFLLEVILFCILFFGIPTLTIYIIAFIYFKIKQVKVSKSEAGEKLNTILLFLCKNDINIFGSDETALDYYIYLNKYNLYTAIKVKTYSIEDIETFYNNCLINLMSVLRKMDYKDCKHYNSYNLYSYLYSDTFDIYKTIKEYKCYKEEMLFISWLLQICYMYYKTDTRFLTKEQSEVLNLIKKETSKIKEKEKDLDRKEKEELFKVFKEQNDKFNNFAKSLYE